MDDFRRWMSGVEREAGTLRIVEQLEELANFYDRSLDRAPTFARLWALGHPPRIAGMRRDSLELLPLGTRSAWRDLIGSAAGDARFEEAATRFDAVDVALRAMLGQVATALVETLSAELDDLLDMYAARKRSAAVLDFDDLLEQACATLRNNEPVRLALGRRYRHIAVDEFQDTDLVQCEILFRLAAEAPAARWQDCVLRPGCLFLVGDPKQAIYRWRGAAAETYEQAKSVVLRSQPDALVTIAANFRSRPGILEHVNRCFRGPLARHGYSDLFTTLEDDPRGGPGVVRMRVAIPPHAKVKDARDAEAEAVARACLNLLESFRIRSEGAERPLRPGDIALLTPTSADIWVYERELHRRGLTVASQAGKDFYRRQEVHDLLALARTLADSADTLAFGSVLRGPLVGLTDAALLDVTAALPPRDGRVPALNVRTPPEHVGNPIASHALTVLQALRRRLASATPHQILSEAVDLFDVRAKLMWREPTRFGAALANVDAVLDLARSYRVRGMAEFADDVGDGWRRREPRREGLPDLEYEAITVMTMHGSKGLEWPVVIPVNSASRFRRRDPFVHRASDDTVHWLIGDVVSPGLAAADAEERACVAQEREQLWYVACTRARDLLVVPGFGDVANDSWAGVLDLALDNLPELDVSREPAWTALGTSVDGNRQSAEIFATEQQVVDAGSVRLEWVLPSNADVDRWIDPDIGVGDDLSVPFEETVVGAGRVRGSILHKLLEEMILGEVAVRQPELEARATVLLARLASATREGDVSPDPVELARTALETTSIPDVAEMWPSLVPELAVYGTVPAQADARPLSGRADAVQVVNGRVVAVIDWKSDVAPGPEQQRDHAKQLRLYLAATGGPRGALVYLTSRVVRWIGPE